MREVLLSGMGAVTSRGDITLRNRGEARLASTSAFIIENFTLEKYLSSQKTYLDRCSALALAGCAMALRDAQIEWPVYEDKFGITLGTHLGCIETMKGFWDNAAQKGVRLANPFLFSHSYFNSPISLCAIEFGLKGYHSTFCAEEYSGLEAVRAAYDAVRIGHADAMLGGGVEAVTPTRVLCEQNQNIGEASVFFVLESGEHAKHRGVQRSLTVTDEFLTVDLQAACNVFGHCGGVTSTLALMLAVVQQTYVKKV